MATAENQKIEFKENWRDDALKTVCVFANTNGGVIYIGLDDGGESVNLKDKKRALTEIPNKIKDFLGIVADVKAVKKGGRDIIKITAGKYNAPISYKGSFYVRSGSTTSELKGVELARFLFARTGTSWDRTVERNASIEDINVDSVRRFQRMAENIILPLLCRSGGLPQKARL